MSLYIKQQNTRSELQEKLAAELQERAKKKARQDDLPDGVDDSAFIKGTKQTSTLAWVWGLVIVFVIGLVAWVTLSTIF